jgi:hypothetical protein
MKRVMVNLPVTVGKKLEQRATAARRSVSSYVGLLIEADLSEAEDERKLLDEARRLGVDTRAVLRTAVISAPRPAPASA